MVPTFSIIIPVKEINDYLRETVPKIINLDRGDWELVVVTNDQTESEWPFDGRIRMMSSGRVGPAEKRDLAARQALGQYLVFLDDDSYPSSNHLSVALREFQNGWSVIGGPAITPSTDTFKQKVSGAVFSSLLTGGKPERYRPVGSARIVDDWPSVNLAIRRDVFLSVGGFDSPYWPGEDTFLCRKLLRSGFEIRYVPDLIVWHHRREGLMRHLKQVGAYGLHRGYFARRLPENSRSLLYFAPTVALLIHVSLLCAVLFSSQLTMVILVGELVYLVAVLFGFMDLIRQHSFQVAAATLPYVLLTHIWYGSNFLRGFVMRKALVSRLR